MKGYIELNGLAYILPKLLKLEKTIKYWNRLEEDKVISVNYFKDSIIVRVYKNIDNIEEALIINRENI
jgi:hypothetical protein